MKEKFAKQSAIVKIANMLGKTLTCISIAVPVWKSGFFQRD